MNKTKKNVLLMAAITLLLVIGTTVTPIQSYASEEHKKNGDLKSSIKSETEVDKKSASQHQDQENFCYRGDDCRQANEGQQIVGKDNEAKGFNDQSKNIQQSVVPNLTQTPTPGTIPIPGNGTTPGLTPTILNVCKEVDNFGSNSFEPSDFIFVFTTLANPNTFQGANEGCTAVAVAPGFYSFTETFPQLAPGGSADTSGGCSSEFTENPFNIEFTFNGTIAAGETQTCTITNSIG
jgi:hypothetical protein